MCYASIFDGKTACIGSRKLIYILGAEYMVDENGEPLFVRSADSNFPTQLSYAVSLYYPLLFEPLDFVVKTFQESGLVNLWESYHKASGVRKGKQAKRKELEADQAESKDCSTDENNLSGFLINSIFLGNGVAMLAFFGRLQVSVCPGYAIYFIRICSVSGIKMLAVLWNHSQQVFA